MAAETSDEDDRLKKHGASATSTASRSATASDDIEQYGVWVKAGPVDIGDDEDSGAAYNTGDLESESGDLTEEEEELLGSLENGESVPVDVETENEDFIMEDLPGLGDEEIAESESEGLAYPPDAGTTGDESMYPPGQEEREALDDISDFELDLTDSNQKDVSMGTPEESTSILQKIERDLLSIKEELTALKNEISSLRSGGAKVEPEEARAEAEPGFFEEDEDETIALTGDELDNILNTADITEQTGESTASPEDSDLLVEVEGAEGAALIDREDVLLSEEEEPPVEVPEISLGGETEELSIDESLVDTASITEEPTEELTLEEPESPEEAEDLLELPEEEEIELEEITQEAESTEEPAGTAPEEIELDLEEAGPSEETTFELDEELDLSKSEGEDLEAVEELAGGEELAELGEVELAEMETEAHEAAPSATADEVEQSVEEAFDLSEEEIELPEAVSEEVELAAEPAGGSEDGLPEDLKSEIRTILRYMDQLLESLPEEKIEEFANSEYFDVYKRLFEELGLTT